MMRVLPFACLFLILAPSAHALPIAPAFPINCITSPCIDFANLTAEGQISYDGNGGPLVGTGITIENIWGFSTPQHNFEALPVQGGVLTFETGNLVDYDPIAGYTFGGGGSFLITGGISALNIAAGTTLAEGSFFEATYGPGPAASQVGMFGLDWKHATIVDYFGLDSTLPFHFGGPLGGGPTLTTPAVTLTGGDFTVDVESVDVPNSPVPEPGTLLLVGAGIAGLAARARSRRGGQEASRRFGATG